MSTFARKSQQWPSAMLQTFVGHKAIFVETNAFPAPLPPCFCRLCNQRSHATCSVILVIPVIPVWSVAYVSEAARSVFFHSLTYTHMPLLAMYHSTSTHQLFNELLEENQLISPTEPPDIKYLLLPGTPHLIRLPAHTHTHTTHRIHALV